jgi:hypothetical protein
MQQKGIKNTNIKFWMVTKILNGLLGFQVASPVPPISVASFTAVRTSSLQKYTVEETCMHACQLQPYACHLYESKIWEIIMFIRVCVCSLRENELHDYKILIPFVHMKFILRSKDILKAHASKKCNLNRRE